jgi:hypothetical protein
MRVTAARSAIAAFSASRIQYLLRACTRSRRRAEYAGNFDRALG